MIKYLLFLMFVLSNNFGYTSAAKCELSKNTKKYLNAVYTARKTDGINYNCHVSHAFAVRGCFELGLSIDEVPGVFKMLQESSKNMNEFYANFEALKKQILWKRAQEIQKEREHRERELDAEVAGFLQHASKILKPHRN